MADVDPRLEALLGQGISTQDILARMLADQARRQELGPQVPFSGPDGQHMLDDPRGPGTPGTGSASDIQPYPVNLRAMPEGIAAGLPGAGGAAGAMKQVGERIAASPLAKTL